MHLIKLCVGISTLEELESYRSQRQHWWGADYGDGMHVHRTRMMPTRAEEITGGRGSIYWVIAGVIRCRQVIDRLQPATDSEGRGCCDIIMRPDLIKVAPRPKRPFQGWRYLAPEDAPLDLDGADGDASGPLVEELARLGLI